MGLKYIYLRDGKFAVSDQEIENSVAFEKKSFHIYARQYEVDYFCFEKMTDIAKLTKKQLSSKDELQKIDLCKKHSCTYWNCILVQPDGSGTRYGAGGNTKENLDKVLEKYESFISFSKVTNPNIQDIELYVPCLPAKYYDKDGAFTCMNVNAMNTFEITKNWQKENVIKKALSIFTKKNSEYAKVGTTSLLLELLKVANEGVLTEDYDSNYESILVGHTTSTNSENFNMLIKYNYKDENNARTFCCEVDEFIKEINPKNTDGNAEKANESDFIIDSKGVLTRYVGCEEEVVIPEGVKKIGESAFVYYSNIKKVILPSTLTQIENSAFQFCENLEEVVCSKKISKIGIEAFFGCHKLRTINLPEKLKKIGERAFKNCWSLKISHLPESLEFIGEFAFYHCSFEDSFSQDILGLSFKNSMCIENNIALYCTNTNVKNLVFTEGVKLIQQKILGKYVESGFIDLPHLESVYISDSVEAIEIANLYNCPHLKDVRLPEQFEFRASYSERHLFFKGCNLPPDHFTGKYDLIKDGLIISGDVLFGSTNKHITKLVIPSGIKTISDSAFKDFRELESVTIPEGVEQIFDEAFMNCSSLSNINLPQSLIRMGDYVFKNCNFSFDFKFTLNNVECGLLPRKTELMFKDGLAIANNAVIYYTSGALKNVDIPEGIERIESLAFFENENIESVKIPSSVKSIGRFAFGNCSLLSCVDIPDSLEDIEDNAFICCELPQNFHQIVGGVVFQNGLCIKDKQLRYFTNSHLEKFEIPGRVEFIQNLFLTGKENIKSITLPRTPVQIDEQGCLFPRGLKELNIPSFLKREYDKSTFKSINFNKVVKFI